MRRRVPPLNSLRQLEAVGRHGSFKRAADELCVTPGAVSRQIKMLEDYLGLELFDRTDGKLETPERTAQYARELSDIFDRIELATGRLLNRKRDTQLNVCCSMTITLRWLVPRLARFHSHYPAWDIRLSAETPVPTVLSTHDIDIAIRLDDHDVEDCVSYWLFSNELVPVCSPRLFETAGPIEKVDDLSKYTLLHSDKRMTHWSDWLSVADENSVDPTQGITFASSSLAYQAALDGLGVAMGQIALVVDDLRAGRLLTPLPILCDDGYDYDVVYEASNTDKKVFEFANWLQKEAELHNEDVKQFAAGMSRRSMPRRS